jgi:hypothetical protein
MIIIAAVIVLAAAFILRRLVKTFTTKGKRPSCCSGKET